MEDLLGMLLELVFELPLDWIDPVDYWRLSSTWISSLALGGLLQWWLAARTPALFAAAGLLGLVGGVVWEWRSRRR